MLERILKLVDSRDLTAKNFEEEIGVYRGALSDWKKGKVKPSSEIIVKIAKYFNVSCDWLLTGKEFENGRLDSFSEEYIARIFYNLNELGRDAALEAISHLCKRQEYKRRYKATTPIHGTSYKTPTQEGLRKIEAPTLDDEKTTF